jgi:hypothetical protein
VDRLREHGVRREEEDPRHLIRERSALHGVAHHDRAEQQRADQRVLQHRPPREAKHTTNFCVRGTEPGNESEAAAPQRDGRHPDERGDTESAPGRQHQTLARREIEPGARARHQSEGDHRDDDDHRQPDGGHGSDREPPFGVEDRDGHRSDGIEEHLGNEEAQQEGGQVALLLGDGFVRDPARQQAGDPGCGDDADDHDDAEHEECNAEQAPGELLRAGVIATVQPVDERRYEDG